MSDNVIMWIVGGCFGYISAVLGITTTKASKKQFEEHCKDQKMESKEFWQAINRNNELLARVDEKLKRDK